MTTAAQIQRHDRIIDSIISDSFVAAQEVAKIVENDTANLILANEDPRLSIRQTIVDRWQRWSEATVSSFDRAAGDTIRLHRELGIDEGGATASDVAVINELKDTSIAILTEPAESIANSIIAGLTVGAITGLTATQMATTARIAISGYLATVEDQNITILQETYRTLIRRRQYDTAKTLMTDIRAAWGATPVGENLLAMSRTASHDAVMDFDSVYGQWRGESLGVTVWRYAGGVSGTTRDFCASVSGREFTREQARELWASQSWGGKRSGDPFVVRGGYNCRHYWVPVNKNIVGNLRRLQQ